MSTKKKMLWLLSLLPFFIACGDDNTDIPDWPWAEPETPTEPVEANPDIVNLGWANVKALMEPCLNISTYINHQKHWKAKKR